MARQRYVYLVTATMDDSVDFIAETVAVFSTRAKANRFAEQQQRLDAGAALYTVERAVVE